MARFACVLACGLAVWLLGLKAAQDGPQVTFRAAVDIVDVDVSVLDRNRLPVRGLTAHDFTVFEDGTARPIAAFSAVDLPTRELPTAPWMADIAPDVLHNEFPREGRLITILMDRSIRVEQLRAAVSFAEAAIDQMRPGDLAAVVYATLGVPQNFTADRARLLAAIRQPVTGLPEGDDGSPGECYCGSCSLEAVTDIAESMLPVRQRRKVLLFVGSNISIMSTGMCGGILNSLRERAIRALQAGNVTVHTFDPTGLETLLPGASAPSAVSPTGRSAAMAAMLRRGNVAILPDHTGGRVVGDPFRAADNVAALLRESTSYYVLGFVPSAPTTSKRFHRIEVRVNRVDVALQARRGYYGPAAVLRPSEERKSVSRLPPMLRSAVEGLWPKTEIALAVSAVPLARPSLDRASVAAIVAAKQVFDRPSPALFTLPVPTTVNVLVGAFDRRGEAVSTVRQTVSVTPRAGVGAAEYEVISRLDLRPGRYEIRAAVEDTRLGRSGSVYTYLDVPNYRQAPVELSGLLVEAVPARVSAPASALSDLLSFVPTARRTFGRADKVTGFVRVYQGVSRALTPGYVVAQVTNDKNVAVFTQESRVVPDQFGAGRSLDFFVELPMATLPAGEYLLSIEARTGNETARRDARFRVLP